MAWLQTHKKKGWRQTQAQTDMAAELVRSLFGSKGYVRDQRPEWQCKGCGTKNFMDRKECRQCHLAKGAPKSKTVPEPAQKKPDFWCLKAEAAKKAEATESALEAARAKGGHDGLVKKLEEELCGLKKASSDGRSTLSKVQSTRLFVSRAEKRCSTLHTQITQLQESAAAAAAELDEARARLRVMEAEAAAELEKSSAKIHPIENVALKLIKLLESASFVDLPPTIVEAMEEVHSALGTDQRAAAENDDFVDLPMDDISAGCEDPPEEDSDEILLAWARKAKQTWKNPYATGVRPKSGYNPY